MSSSNALSADSRRSFLSHKFQVLITSTAISGLINTIEQLENIQANDQKGLLAEEISMILNKFSASKDIKGFEGDINSFGLKLTQTLELNCIVIDPADVNLRTYLFFCILL